MKAKFRCPQCSQSITVGPEAMGKRGKCPGCQEVIKIPTAEQFAAAAKAKQPKPEPVPAVDEPDPFGDDLSSPDDAWDDLDLGKMDVADSGSTTLAPLPKVKAKKGGAGKRGGDIEAVRMGQKFVLFAILLNLSAILLVLALGGQPIIMTIARVGAFASIVIGLIGLIRMTGGFGYSIIARIFLCLLMVFPLIGLITLLILNSKATKQLRANGYEVGFFGA